MNRMQFMQRLSQLLKDLPDEERFDALKYYNNYFDDAGEENEAQIIAELGSPEAVATVIKGEPEIAGSATGSGAENQINSVQHTDVLNHVNGTSSANGTYNSGNMNTGGYTYSENGADTANTANDRPKKRWSTGAKVGIIILCVLASPMIIALAAAAFGIAIAIVAVAFSIIITIFAAFVSVSTIGIGCTLGGLGMFGIGIYRCVTNVANGLMIGGVGFVITAVGILACIVAWLAWAKATPAVCRWIGRCCRRLVTRRKRA